MIRRLLVANRGEIAVRILTAAAELEIETVGIAPEDDRTALHMRRAGEALILRGNGPAAYLDGAQILEKALGAGCDAIHPGYGFLSESADFAESCATAGIIFVGPAARHLNVLGDKAKARNLAQTCGVPVLEGTCGAVTLEEMRAFMTRIAGPVIIKAVSGGGGRGIRLVGNIADLPEAFERCASEAVRAFGDARLYAEQALPEARHIEVQIFGDAGGAVIDLGERDCSLQRRHQKLVEIAPSPFLGSGIRRQIIAAARKMAASIQYLNAGTFEFLLDCDGKSFYFLEANPRVQVEHTVTEEVWGVDIVRTQILIASGKTLADLALGERSARPGFALQARVNMERLLADGTPVMDGGVVTAFDPPTGPGVRVDSYAYRGYTTNVAYDSLLAKLIVSTLSDYPAVLAKAGRALAQFDIQGVDTNIALLRGLLAAPDVIADKISTRFVDSHLDYLLAAADALSSSGIAGRVDVTRPVILQVDSLPDDMIAVPTPLTGVLVKLAVAQGDVVLAGAQVAIVEAMKMEHVVVAPASGVVRDTLVEPGMTVAIGQSLATIEIDDRLIASHDLEADRDLNAMRPDLVEVKTRHEDILDAGRTDAIARRHAKHMMTAREQIDALCEPGSFREYGGLVVAGQRARRSMEELIRRTPADGVVVGFGEVNRPQFSANQSQSLIIAFDETVLAGTMGEMAREKLKHILEVTHQARRPVILFAEGGGGRAGDTDLRVAITGWTMDVSSYFQLARMSGLVPLVGLATGRCFAANAGMLACCDVIIATEHSNIGVGGPSMIEGGRLGVFTPEEIGPSHVQTKSGVIDILVPDESAGVEVAKKYLSYFQGSIETWEAEDQRQLRFVVPENRLRSYDVRAAIRLLADIGSVLELREHFGVGIVTSLIRVEGRPVAVIANNPLHLGGAVDSESAHKACRFMRLCEAFRIPILMLCDTPGMMVGPEAEKTATVRAMGRMFVTGANLTVPFFTIVLRKAYGIGALLMSGGWFRAPRFTVSWPTGEFGGMNIEGNVKLAHAAELAAIADPVERQALFEERVAEMLTGGRALAVATHNELDDVIDPAESRAWIMTALASHMDRTPSADKSVPFVDPW